MKSINARGFTLLELLMTLGIAAILMTVAVPGVQALIQDDQQASEINQLAAALRQGRNQAINHRARVSICKSTDLETCAEPSSAWEEGLIVFLDRDGDGRVDEADGESILNAFESLGIDTAELGSADFDRFVSFNPDGSTGRGGQFVLCDSRGEEHAKALCLLKTGRWRVSDVDCNDGSALVCS